MMRYERQSFLGADSDRVLSRITIGFVGLGGGGSHVVQQTAHLGVGGYVLVDPDVIEVTNLNRLVGGTVADVQANRAKVDIAERVIRAVNPQARIKKIQSKWQEALDHLKGCDIIFGGLDSVTAKDDLDAFCRRFLIPYIDMGMDVNSVGDRFIISGQVVLSTAGGPCLRCYGVVQEARLAEEGRRYGAAGSRPQVVWPNGVLASTAVGLFVQLVCPWHDHPIDRAYFEYDGNQGVVVHSNRLAALDGRKCSHHPEHETGDAGFDIRKSFVMESAQAPKRPWWFRILDKLRNG